MIQVILPNVLRQQLDDDGSSVLCSIDCAGATSCGESLAAFRLAWEEIGVGLPPLLIRSRSMLATVTLP
jgi:hypothetical protein